MTARKPLKIVSISHGWLTPEHPDPRGQQLVNFASIVRRETNLCAGTPSQILRKAACFSLSCGLGLGCCCCCFPLYGQECCHASQNFPSGEFAVFYDYCSLFQKDGKGERTPEEGEAFRSALATMGAWYAHQLTTTIILNRLPEGWPQSAASASVFPPGWLKGKGWPTFERSVSTLIKPANSFSFRRIVDADDSNVMSLCDDVRRTPPLHPKTFAAIIARKIFSNGSDCEVVANLYADTFLGTFGASKKLVFDNSSWTSDDAVSFAEILPLAFAASTIEISGNFSIGKRGFDALANAIADGSAPQLRMIAFDRTQFLATRNLQAACRSRGIHILGTESVRTEGVVGEPVGLTIAAAMQCQ